MRLPLKSGYTRLGIIERSRGVVKGKGGGYTSIPIGRIGGQTGIRQPASRPPQVRLHGRWILLLVLRSRYLYNSVQLK